jgi:hypothetical protein
MMYLEFFSYIKHLTVYICRQNATILQVVAWLLGGARPGANDRRHVGTHIISSRIKKKEKKKKKNRRAFWMIISLCLGKGIL